VGSVGEIALASSVPAVVAVSIGLRHEPAAVAAFAAVAFLLSMDQETCDETWTGSIAAISLAQAPAMIDAALEAVYGAAAIDFPFTDLIVADPYADLSPTLKHDWEA
jgi:hypothetical protein